MQLKDAPLSLGVMCTVGPLRFIGFLSEFGAGHPGIEVSLSEDRPDRLLDLLMSGKLDIAIMTRPDTENERIETWQLYEERFVVAFPAGHRFATMTEVPINEIAGESYLLRSHCEKSDELADLLESRMVEYDCIYQSEREDWIQSMIMAGMGSRSCRNSSHSARIADPAAGQSGSGARRQLGNGRGRRFSPAVAAFVKAVDRSAGRNVRSWHYPAALVGPTPVGAGGSGIGAWSELGYTTKMLRRYPPSGDVWEPNRWKCIRSAIFWRCVTR